MKLWEAKRFVPETVQDRLRESFREGHYGASPGERDIDTLIIWAATVVKGDLADAGDVAKSFLRCIINGQAMIAGIKDGEPLVKLTPLGMNEAESIIAASPEARELIHKLDARHGTEDITRRIFPGAYPSEE